MLTPGKRLIEPFVGSGAVFLNCHYSHTIIGDSNPDLINLYQHLIKEQKTFVRYCQKLFSSANNSEEYYYQARKEFNTTGRLRRKAALFVYLNRHCYNGLCRYNSRGEFNTPFGRYKKPYFPEQEMLAFCQRAQSVQLINANFDETMRLAKRGDVIYCDPPYAPLTDTAYFTDYHVGGFNWDDQILLAETAIELSKKNIRVVISNHDTKEIRKLYKGSKISRFDVQRNISCKGSSRKKVGELLAVF